MNPTNITLQSNNIFQLIGLHRILFKSKFQHNVHDLYSLFGSQWQNGVLDAIIEYYREINDIEQLKEWTNWRILTKRRLEYPIIVEKLKEIKIYVEKNNLPFPLEEKIENIRMVISPFVLSKDLLDELTLELS